MTNGIIPSSGRVVRTIAATMLVPALFGCSKPAPPVHFTMVSGKVLACRTDTGELTLRGGRPREGKNVEHTVNCLITQNSELYINGRLATIQDIRLGDTVEVIGRIDATSKPHRFVVSVAYIDHPFTPPPEPVFAPPAAATRPATRPTRP